MILSFIFCSSNRRTDLLSSEQKNIECKVLKSSFIRGFYQLKVNYSLEWWVGAWLPKLSIKNSEEKKV